MIDAESGWVSDNYLAYCRLVKWMYHPITTLQTDKVDKHCLMKYGNIRCYMVTV